MWVNRDKPKLKMERGIDYISASSYTQYQKSPNTFWATRLIEDALPREPSGLAARVGTAFDIAVKLALHDLGVPIHEGATLADIQNSLEDDEHTLTAKGEGKKILFQYKMAGLLTNKPSVPLARRWEQIEGVYKFMVGDVPILAKLDAVVKDPYTKKPAPLDWKVIGGGAKAGVSPKKGFAGSCSMGEWLDGHKLWKTCEAKSPNAGYEGVNIPCEEIDPAFARQFCIYGWALQGDKINPASFEPFPVHFDSAVYNGKNRVIKIYSYRAIISKDFQQKLFNGLRAMWFDLNEQGGISLRNRLTSNWNITAVKQAAGKETWF